MINKHNGMTLAEIIVALGIVGVLAAVSIPQINKVKPNQEMIKFKKAYAITTRVVNEMLHDDELYPDIAGDPDGSGFANTNKVIINGVAYGGEDEDSRKQKFCKLFASRMKTIGDVNCNAKGYYTESRGRRGLVLNQFEPSFTTADGIQWGIAPGDFTSEDSTPCIVVDVNGNNGSNCYEYAGVNASVAPGIEPRFKCNNGDPDRFMIKVNRIGQVWVDGDVEKAYLDSTRTTKTYKQLVKEKTEGSD